MQSSLLSNTPPPSLNCESSSDEGEITLDEICDRNYELSLLERLPRELVMEIISFAPECVFRLRLTSRMFRAIVDDFAYNQGNAQIADEVMFTSFECESKKKTEVSAVVPKPIYKLFELRLLISLRALRFDFTKRIDRSFDKLDDHPNVYKLNYTSAALDYGRMPLLQCVGKRIHKVTLFNCYGKNLAEIGKQLKEFEFRRLEVSCEQLTRETASQLINIIKAHNIDCLYLSVGKVVGMDTDFLLSLSTLVRSLYLEQLQVFGTSGWSPKYFFGTHHVDWSATILRMFERRLDALCIENPRYPAYLTAEAAEVLREYLPKTGKAVWFEATCSVYSDEGFAEVTNGHLVKGVTFDFNRAGSLSVKHFSRNEERLSKYE